ncbi:MAG: hypothetical protein NTZ79_17265 [Proteobacteria bacterium]|nr:hypothetical protein [Pseudomonadota bacterium]
MAIGTGLDTAAAGALDMFKSQVEQERQAAIVAVQAQLAQQTHQANARSDADLADQRWNSRAAQVKEVLAKPAAQPNAQIAADAGLNDPTNAGADENVGVDVQRHSQPATLQDMALAAARAGHPELAKELAAADYYSGRNTLAAGRLAQGDRRLDLTEDLNGAKIDNLDSRSDLADARTAASGDGPKLTSAQLVRNSEIDAARKKIDGLNPAAIRAKTAKFSATGRENPDSDPSLSRAAGLAARRKVGDDGWFDSQNSGGNAQTGTTPRADVADLANRFAADAAMKGMRMGALTPKGREVMDASGKLVGYYH